MAEGFGVKIKKERGRLASRTSIGGPLMYPGEYVFTWALIGATWHLIGMEQVGP